MERVVGSRDDSEDMTGPAPAWPKRGSIARSAVATPRVDGVGEGAEAAGDG
jgi:hypothetical protein